LVALILAAGIWPSLLDIVKWGDYEALEQIDVLFAPHSPWLFHMNSGSCNGCDIELVASLTPRYDAEQLGVRLEGSPRHADILCITGPVTHNAVKAIQTVYGQVCGPKAVVAIGSCPATTNVFIDSRTLDGPLNKHIPVDVFVPGCPPRPDAIIQGVAKALKSWPSEA